MAKNTKRDLILDALEELLKSNTLNNINVSDIAKTAGIGKGSIYYYFESKNEILDSLVERNYKNSIDTARNLASNKDIAPFTRMAMIFQACRNTTKELMSQSAIQTESTPEKAFLHQKYMSYLIKELTPVLSTIISQGIASGDINFDKPEALAEIVLIVLTVKLDNTIVESSVDDITTTIQALIELLEKGTDNPIGSLNFLIS